MWKCSNCRAEIQDNLNACWQCGTGREGTRATAVAPSAAAQDEPELLCSRCGCNEVIPNARVLDYSDAGVSDTAQVEVLANPDAWFFTGARSSPLRAQVCGRCGHVELFVDHPEYLLEAYRKSRER